MLSFIAFQEAGRQ